MPSLSLRKTLGPARHFLHGLVQWAGRAWSYAVHTPTLWIPLALLCGATLFFRLTKADLVFSRTFFLDVHSTKESLWPLGIVEPWTWLYRFGVLPAWFLGVGGLAVALVGCFWSKLRRYRGAGLFFALMLALGPGLIINGIFKPLWGRPRPHSTVPFGGASEFLPVWTKGTGAANMSFPSGHASMGFYLMAPAFVLYRRRPRWAAVFLLIGLTAGALMGLTRIVAGSHFASDVLWSAGIVYFTGLGLSALFGFYSSLKGFSPSSALPESSGAGSAGSIPFC